MLLGLTAWADIPNGYYTNAIGKQDEALMTALEGIIYTHNQLGYNSLWDIYDNTDKPLEDTIREIGEGINREHSFPKSWFGGEVYPMYTDLTMLIPTDAFVNQRRSNNPYGVCANGITYTNDDLGVTMLGKLGTSTYNGYTATVFEPDDEYKGDFARIYFYMVTCYKRDVKNWPGCGQLDYATNDYKAFSNWSIKMLMEWHRADPVSPKEISRNEAVYLEQGNRNPYVDHPELAEYIWGTKQNTTWTGEGGIDPIDKEVPIMQPVDNSAIEATAFRANWTAVDNVSSYTLKVSRVEDTGATLLMSENFSNIKATADGYNDISGSLDDYTDNPGWTGYSLYPAANQSLKFGTTSKIGYIISPDLQLGSTVTVVFNAKSWISSSGTSDGSSVIVSCGDVSTTVALTDTPTDYTVVLTGCTSQNIKLAMTAVKKRFYIYNVNIYKGDLTARAPHRAAVEEGDSTWRVVSGIDDDHYTVRALAGGTYEYMVKAIYTDGTQSVWSNIEHVTLTGNGDEPLVGDVNGDGEVSIADVTALIDYLLSPGTTLDEDVADVNHDGEVTIGDVTALIDLLLGGN